MPAAAVDSTASQGPMISTERSTRYTRHQVPSACLQCRKRKVKCSGKRPTCGRCSAQEIECEWDTEPDTSRVVSIRKRKEELERENEDLHEFLRFLYLRPEQEAVEIFKRLRISGDALQVLEIVRSGDLLLQRLRADRNASSPEPMQTSPDAVHHFEHSLNVPAKPWTELADDAVVSELMAGFFQWDEPFLLVFVDEKSFLEDMRQCSPETARYCSPLLVNAICALRSHTSRRAKAFRRVNGRDMRLAFFDEARRQLDLENGRVSLPTAEALFIMHLMAAALGMDRATRMYHLLACDMVQELDPAVQRGTDKSGREQYIFSRAVWGMYCFESIFAFLYLRPSFLPMPSIPRFFVFHDTRNLPYISPRDTRTTTILNATCDLSTISNKTMKYNKNVEYYELGKEADIYKRISLFGELQVWREGIPQEIKETTPFDSSAYFLR
ncbi:C6 transcription factor [Colletotrichum incanum]|nr:C6 transcription factor [Colletotrichum incanum]